jgi:hypothetical protein
MIKKTAQIDPSKVSVTHRFASRSFLSGVLSPWFQNTLISLVNPKDMFDLNLSISY